MKPSICLAVALAAVLVLSAAEAHAVPTQVSFAGRLVDADGPVDGSVDLRFRLFAGSTQVWEENHAGVTATGGMVFAALGSVTALEADLFDGGALSLEIAVDGQTLGPRLDLLSVPYAMRAGVADRLGTLAPGDVALATHDHDGDYLPLGGALACAGTQKMTGINGTTGQVVCAADVDTDTNTTYSAGGGLAQVGTTFSVATGGINAAHLATDSVGSVEIAVNAVGSSEIAASAVGASELAGAEITIYRVDDAGCEAGLGGLMMTSTCQTRLCPGDKYMTCSGACNVASPDTCANAVFGKVLPSTF